MKNPLNLHHIKQASLQLSQKSDRDKNTFLKYLAEVIAHNKEEIVKANVVDVHNAKKNNLSGAFIQRLILDENGIKSIIKKVNSLKNLNSSLGSIVSKRKLANGIVLKKVVVPLGVIMVIYEARPEVTIDVAALCIKSGNAVILKGGSEASNTNKALFQCILTSLEKAKFSRQTISLIENRNIVSKLLKQNDSIDLVIARGGYEMVKKIISQSKIPVLAHSAGGARIYIDKSADLKIVNDILINAKTSKPAACNSLDAILIHKDIASVIIPNLVKEFKEMNIRVLGDEHTNDFANVEKASKLDWETEFLRLTVAIKIVANAQEAIQFINKYSKRHSEGIIATDKSIISKFVNSLDTAAVFINCSTRFHDGYEFGLGSEIGIATGKLHARGPVGLKELTTYRWEAYGNGQIRA